MTTRLGIELSPFAFRFVELDAPRRWRQRDGDTRVLSFASTQGPLSVSIGSPETAARLAAFRGQHVSVVLWGSRAVHQQVEVLSAPYDRMRLEVASHLRGSGWSTGATLFDIAPVQSVPTYPTHRVVLVAAAPAAEVTAAIAPLLSAGLNVRSVLTPAGALQSLSRLKSAAAGAHPADGIEACVALEETATCLAVVQGGNLVAARDLPWGFLDEFSDFRLARERGAIAGRLADELREFLGSLGVDRRALSQAWVTGGMPELRSMAATLTALIDVEVDTLDSLFGIDDTRLPGPGDEFREQIADLRLAWAAAADRRPSLDLFRERRRRRAGAYLSRAAVVAGTAAGLGVGWLVQRTLPSVEPVHRTARPAPARAVRKAPELDALASRATVPADAVLVDGNPPALPSSSPDQAVEFADPLASGPRRPWESAPPVVPRVVAVAAAAPPQAPRQPILREAQAEMPREAAAPAGPPKQVEAAAARRPSREPSQPRQPAVDEAPLPFDAALETILYGRDRTLAIVDGRIIEPGDELRGARVVEITASAVLLRDAQGRLRKLSLGAKGR